MNINKKLFNSAMAVLLLFSSAACTSESTAGTGGVPPTVTPRPTDSAKAIGSSIAAAGPELLSISRGDKETLSITVCWDHYEVDDMVSMFNKKYPGIKVEVNNYHSDYEKYSAQVATQLMAGKSDDIIDSSYLPLTKLADNGLLTGLRPLMENDAAFDPDDYYMNVFEAMYYQDDLYIFPVTFTYALAGVNSRFSEQLVSDYCRLTTVTNQDLLDLYNRTPDKDGYYIKSNGNFNPLYVVVENIDHFIDFENKTCNFNSYEFINLIKDVQKVMEPPTAAAGSGYFASLKELLQLAADKANKYLFKDIQGSGYFANFLPYKEMDSYTQFIPYTNKNGEVYVYPGIKYSVSGKSQNKELAWEFIKFSASPEANEYAKGQSLFVRRDTFKAHAEKKLYVSIEELSSNGIYLEGDHQKHVEKAIARLDELNRMPMHYSLLSDICFDILSEDMELYSKGIMSAEQTAADLQNRISLALME